MGFTTKIVKGQLQVTTNVDQPEVAFGENLTGTVYIEGCEDEAAIDYIQLEVLIQDNHKERTITKHDIQMVGNLKSKEAEMILFEIVPDDRWMISEGQQLVLRTSLQLFNEETIRTEEKFMYNH